MKKLIRFCTVTGIVLTLAGIGITTAAMAMGASLEYTAIARENRWEFIDSLTERFWPRHTDFLQNGGGALYEGVENIELDIRSGKVIFLEDSEGGQVRVVTEGISRDIDIGMDGDTLKISLGGTKDWLFGEFWNDRDSGSIFIYVPEGQNFGRISIDMKAGFVSAGNLSASKLSADMKAGALEIQGGNADELSLECGAGSINYEGRVKKSVDADCKVGSINLALEGIQEDFNYEINCKLGAVSIQDQTISGLSRSTEIDNGASKDMKLKCYTGEITVEFGNAA